MSSEHHRTRLVRRPHTLTLQGKRAPRHSGIQPVGRQPHRGEYVSVPSLSPGNISSSLAGRLEQICPERGHRLERQWDTIFTLSRAQESHAWRACA